MSKEEAEKMVERLSVHKVHPDEGARQYSTKKLTAEEVEQLLSRIANKDINLSKTPERQRTGADNYFNAWKANEMLSSMK